MPDEKKGYVLKSKAVDLKKIFSIEVGIILVLILTVFLFLNYFNIFSLSTFYPNLFGRLPHRPIVEKLKVIKSDGPISINCPLSEDFCDKGYKSEVVIPIVNKKQSLIVWDLPKYTPIYAAFDGVLKEEVSPLSSTLSARTITIQSTNGRYQANYLFISSDIVVQKDAAVVQSKKIEKGDGVGIIYDYYFDEARGGGNFQFNIALIDSQTILDIDPQSVGSVTLP